jgi:hypothetical protein
MCGQQVEKAVLEAVGRSEPEHALGNQLEPVTVDESNDVEAKLAPEVDGD